MALFPPNFIEDLKSHADIVQVVQERVALRRSGATWKGLCPFHGEKTPSFHVNGDKGFFHCFGCGAKGDVFEFVKLYDKITFPEAVRQVAARAGMPVPSPRKRPGSEQARPRDTLRAHEVAATWFREQLAAPQRRRAPRLPRPIGDDRLRAWVCTCVAEALKTALREGWRRTRCRTGLVERRAACSSIGSGTA
jgi:DNA primase